MPLRTIARCLRGIASMFASRLGQHRLSERHVKVLARPVGLSAQSSCATRGASTPQLVGDLAAASASNAAAASASFDRDAAVHAKWQRRERMAEQPALHLRERAGRRRSHPPARRERNHVR